MPTRLIREGILSSEKIASLTWEAEVFYRRLMSVVDDYGVHPAHLSLLRAALYPLQLDKMPERGVKRALAECEGAALVQLYAVDGKEYVRVCNFGQAIRSEPKYPLPSNVAIEVTTDSKGKKKYSIREQLQACENNCKQLLTPVHLDVVEDGGVPRALARALDPDEYEQMHRPMTTQSTPKDETEVYNEMRNVPACPLPPSEIGRCASAFYGSMQAQGWIMANGAPVRNWKPLAKSYMMKWASNNSAREMRFNASNKATGETNHKVSSDYDDL